jgi:manganese transport protein
MAGHIIMEGFINFRLPPWQRCLVTRAIAIVPAAGVTIAYGESGTAQLLILSPVVLSLQLPFAVVPLVMFTASKAKMGELVSPHWLTALSYFIAVFIAGLNIKLLFDLAMGG